MFRADQTLSISNLLRLFWRQVGLTWGLTLLETFMLAALPLLIGRSIDGLLAGDWGAFVQLLWVLAALLAVSIGRRVYDTRAYGTMRVELGKAFVKRAEGEAVSAVNARLGMGRELVDFLEQQAPLVLTAIIQVFFAIVVLLSFDLTLALAAGGATVGMLLIYWAAEGRFFRLNRDLNEQVEKQVSVLNTGVASAVHAHLTAIRRHEVRLSDTESLVYGLIFALLIAMLAFNLWYAATQIGASPGQIFSIVTYSYEFIEASVTLPIALQTLTRLAEITKRLNTALGDKTEAQR